MTVDIIVLVVALSELTHTPLLQASPSRRWGLILKGINTLLAHETWAAQVLSRYAGKTLLLVMPPVLTNPDALLEITMAGTLRQVSHTSLQTTVDLHPHVTLTINPSILLAWPMHTEPDRQTLLLRAVHIEGDAALAQILGDLAQQLRPDWEQAISQLVGDVAARRLQQYGQRWLQTTQNSARSLVDNLTEYALYEQPMLVHQSRLMPWQHTIRDLREAVDRLDKRIEKLQYAAKNLQQER